MGKLLIVVGIICILAGILIIYRDRIPFAGKLPGDILIEKENFSLFFPITTTIIISLLVSVVLYLINKFR